MKGYKAFDKYMQCRDYQFEIGKTYTFEGNPIPCRQGFHFCKSVADCYSYYPMNEDRRVCEVEAIGDVETDDDVKYCTNKIMIIREVENPRVASNASVSSSGYCNSGDRNSGDWNSGDWNTAFGASGCFNTSEQPITMFNKTSEWTLRDWWYSEARSYMCEIPRNVVEWICSDNMTEEEKAAHPEHETTGGYLKVLDEGDCAQVWWNGLEEYKKSVIMSLPNFDARIFKECTGIDVSITNEPEEK